MIPAPPSTSCAELDISLWNKAVVCHRQMTLISKILLPRLEGVGVEQTGGSDNLLHEWMPVLGRNFSDVGNQFIKH